MARGLRCTSVWGARTCSTSLVPIPKASAPKAPWVAVWLSPQTIVMPGWVSPSSGPMTWTMPWCSEPSECSGMPNSAQLRSSVSTCVRESASRMRAATGVPSVGTLWSAVASVRSGRRTGRPARRRPSKAWGLVTSWTRWRSMKMRPGATSWADQILSNRVVGVMRSFLGLAASKAGGDDREQRRLLRAGVLEEVREIRVEGDDVARAERDGLGVAVQDDLAVLDERGLARAGFVHRRVARTARARAGVQHVPGQLGPLAGQGRRQD